MGIIRLDGTRKPVASLLVAAACCTARVCFCAPPQAFLDRGAPGGADPRGQCSIGGAFAPPRPAPPPLIAGSIEAGAACSLMIETAQAQLGRKARVHHPLGFTPFTEHVIATLARAAAATSSPLLLPRSDGKRSATALVGLLYSAFWLTAGISPLRLPPPSRLPASARSGATGVGVDATERL
jgi:hypothetical protein